MVLIVHKEILKVVDEAYSQVPRKGDDHSDMPGRKKIHTIKECI
jgi:hypothetical protein